MSAFMVENAHVNAILNLAVLLSAKTEFPEFRFPVSMRRNATRFPHSDDLTTLGKMLLNENAKSLRHLYQDAPENMYFQDEIDGYKFTVDNVAAKGDAGYLAKLIDCYEYQACEHDTFETGEVKAWLVWALKMSLQSLPGYRAAPWGYSGTERAA
ncbi:hypothetical protein [Mesorhizobium sp. M8A.F.Ca.ET.021.01.1.1]|uniref:hypothetical protein n=1 Tax=Mesorhizobium sp. M8A.F.Ca.ET.021.01.1.1 TaxID=2496757 RepID=UPI000FCA49BD|nr:hypothetical protein [Mesorhizobium sp. M8A.F.Ca.ET.021.01.1.1]RUW56704.1 hypothetical protein EOA36_02650 [Mesorhizobium sp. M8A.F.Ca.ET.021.01.1.1]